MQLILKCETADAIRETGKNAPCFYTRLMFELVARDAYRGPLELPAFLKEIRSRGRMNKEVKRQVCGNCTKIKEGLPTFVFCEGCRLQEYCSYKCQELHLARHLNLCDRALAHSYGTS